MKRSLRFVLPLLALVVAAGGFVVYQPAPAEAPVAITRAAAPTAWTLDKAHSKVGFKVRHLGITNVNGEFSLYDAQVTLDPADLRTLKVNANVDVSSINTDNERRDGHLKSPDFFDAANHPKMTFVSKGISDVKGMEFKMAGDLTIRGTTKPVVLDVEMVGPIAGPGGKQRVGFTGTTRINRMDYGLKWNNLTEAGGVVVSENVDIVLEIEAIQDAPAN